MFLISLENLLANCVRQSVYKGKIAIITGQRFYSHRNLRGMDDIYECSCCGESLGRSQFDEIYPADRVRAVKSQCKRCRRKLRYWRLYGEPCRICSQYTKLDLNRWCRKCNDKKEVETGLRICQWCGNFETLFGYHGKNRTCEDCAKLSKPARHIVRKEVIEAIDTPAQSG